MNTELTKKESSPLHFEARLLNMPVGSRQPKRVVGRGIGSKRGKTAGRGMKGYKSRAGNGKNIGFEGGQMPLLRRLPKVGFSNFPHRNRHLPIKIRELEKRFEAGETVSLAMLLARGVIKTLNQAVKLVGGGQLTKKLIVSSKIRATASVKKQIEAQGGGIS